MSEKKQSSFHEADMIGEIFQVAKDVGDFACSLHPFVEEENCTKEEFFQQQAKKYEAFSVEDLSKRCPSLYEHLKHQNIPQEVAHYMLNALTPLRFWCKTLKNKNYYMEEFEEVHALAQDFFRIQSNLLCFVYFYCELYEGTQGYVRGIGSYCKRCNVSVSKLVEQYENFFPPHPDQWTVKEQFIMGKFSQFYPNAFYFAGNHDIMPKISEMELCLQDEVEEWSLLEALKEILEEMYENGELDIDDPEELEEYLNDDDASLSFYLWSDYIWTSL